MKPFSVCIVTIVLLQCAKAVENIVALLVQFIHPQRKLKWVETGLLACFIKILCYRYEIVGRGILIWLEYCIFFHE